MKSTQWNYKVSFISSCSLPVSDFTGNMKYAYKHTFKKGRARASRARPAARGCGPPGRARGGGAGGASSHGPAGPVDFGVANGSRGTSGRAGDPSRTAEPGGGRVGGAPPHPRAARGEAPKGRFLRRNPTEPRRLPGPGRPRPRRPLPPAPKPRRERRSRRAAAAWTRDAAGAAPPSPPHSVCARPVSPRPAPPPPLHGGGGRSCNKLPVPAGDAPAAPLPPPSPGSSAGSAPPGPAPRPAPTCSRSVAGCHMVPRRREALPSGRRARLSAGALPSAPRRSPPRPAAPPTRVRRGAAGRGPRADPLASAGTGCRAAVPVAQHPPRPGRHLQPPPGDTQGKGSRAGGPGCRRRPHGIAPSGQRCQPPHLHSLCTAWEGGGGPPGEPSPEAAFSQQLKLFPPVLQEV